MIKHFKNELILALLLFILVVFFGTVSYHWSQNFDWIDALYMTIITITTVGFGEVHPLNNIGKLITILLILMSIVVYAYTITVVTEYVIGENIFYKLIKKRMENKIQKLQNHVIITGYGRTGKQAAQKLKNYRKKVVVIDTQKPEEDNLIDYSNVFFIEGDATNDEVLLKAGIKQADSLLTTLPTDADNLFVVLSGRQLNPSLKIVTRATNETTANKMKLAGADKIIMPEVIGGEFMGSLVVTPDLVEFLNALSIENESQKTHLEEILFQDLPPEYQGKSIADLDLRKKTGCTVIGYKTPDGQYIINPSANTKIKKNSAIIVLGQPEQIQNLNKLFKTAE
jgi:voltage-gated potassium channel